MGHMLGEIDEGEIEKKDEETGLYLFMLAAVGGGEYKYDLGSVFQLIKISPECLIAMFDGSNVRKRRKYE